ncbi:MULTISPECIES: ABC transporter ATP-binding protein [Nocardiaceae]|uniref:ABC-2 type transport system ATP-binding protein n=1 Tax=Rhodococcoides corynebacterioides TaxID=53972 RepID=A0ABS2KST5_9NOCA|nr:MULTISPECIES: ABC transporter ATP-binding protein [Rhodococcus]MBM7414927.1 ABC-2 type transport system ATP-binding protein [Rhodococcus corynebacterioides]MBP1117389.1 ABC-2 type transport system ATP-binding protein [Rhodococcus sp. PvP016]
MTATVATVRGVAKSFGDVAALENVTFEVQEHRIHGLLGRNGAGKTTMMQILTGQTWQDVGDVEVFGARPFENATVLRDVCFVKESQKYPEDFTVGQVLSSAASLMRDWDEDFARRLADDFDLPRKRKVKKLSRGMTSALGVVVGLASRAPLTLFDEPYLGLDAVARQMFYDQLLADFAEHPRTVVLSTHLIDEVSELIDRVVVISDGTVVVDDDAENLRGRAVTIGGSTAAVERLVADRAVLHRESFGSMARTTVVGPLTDADLARAATDGLSIEPVSLQQFVVHCTSRGRTALPAVSGTREDIPS